MNRNNRGSISLFLGASLGALLEYVNISIGGLTTTLPGGFRLHHLWVGLILVGVGFYLKAYFFVGLGTVLAVGDWFEHQRPDGSVAPFW